MAIELYRKAIGATVFAFVGSYGFDVAPVIVETDKLFDPATYYTPLGRAVSMAVVSGLGAFGFANKMQGKNVIQLAKERSALQRDPERN